MKRSVLYWMLLFGALGFNSCTQQEEQKKQKEYRVPNRPDDLLYIKGEINGMPPLTSVALYRLHPRTGAPILLTQKKVKSTTFSFPVTVKTPTFYLLLVGKTRQIPVLMNKSDVMVTANYQNVPNTLIIEGARDAELLIKLQDMKKKLSRKRQSMSSEEYAEVRETTIENFIDRAMPSLICITAVSSLPLEKYGDEYDEVIAQLEETHPDSPYLEAFKESTALKQKYSVGATLPADQRFSLHDGKVITLDQLRGKYVLLDFWQTRYPNIGKDNALLAKTYEMFPDDLEIISVSLDSKPDTWQKAIENLPWKHVYDVDQEDYYSPTAARYGYFTLNTPITFLLDPEGKIIDKGIRGAELAPRLKKLLEKP